MRSRKRSLPNSPFTIAWQSSKVPSTAMAWTLAASTVVICRCWIGETRPSGKRMKTSALSRPAEGLDRRRAGIAGGRADDRHTAPASASIVVHQPRDQLHRHVLERQGRAVKQLQHELIGTDLAERNHRRMAERGIGVDTHMALSASSAISPPMKAGSPGRRPRHRVGRPARRSPRASGAASVSAQIDRRRRQGLPAGRRKIQMRALAPAYSHISSPGQVFSHVRAGSGLPIG